MSGRHRRQHVVGLLQAAAAALDRGRAVRANRDQLIHAAEQGDPASIFKLDAIAASFAWSLDMAEAISASSRRTLRTAPSLTVFSSSSPVRANDSETQTPLEFRPYGAEG